jgi:hypothetical protein
MPITDLNLEQRYKLEDIFLPYYTERRKTLFGQAYEKPAARFVHYTSADGALKIIRSKQLWMRNAKCMNDYREVRHGYDVVWRFFSDETKRNEFYAALDTCLPGLAQKAIVAFDNLWRDIEVGTYITSVSGHDDREDQHGRLSMWRAFGVRGPRVALVFNIPVSSQGSLALNLMFSPVGYLPENDVHKSLLQAIANVRSNCDFLRSIDQTTVISHVTAMFLAAVTCLKHEGFHEEREWRAIYFPEQRGSQLMQSNIEVVDGIPQLVYKIPLDEGTNSILADIDLSRILRRVIVGPTQYGPAIGATFTAELFRLGVTDADQCVVLSGIPIRS